MVVVIVVAALAVGAALWWFAVQSRRTWVCPSCGNEITAEYMEASSCSICGAPLREVEGNHDR